MVSPVARVYNMGPSLQGYGAAPRACDFASNPGLVLIQATPLVRDTGGTAPVLPPTTAQHFFRERHPDQIPVGGPRKRPNAPGTRKFNVTGRF